MISIFGKKWKLSRGGFTFVFVSCSHSNSRQRRLINWFGWLLGQDRWPHYARVHDSTPRRFSKWWMHHHVMLGRHLGIWRSKDLESAFEKGNGSRSPIPQIYVCHMLINVKTPGPRWVKLEIWAAAGGCGGAAPEAHWNGWRWRQRLGLVRRFVQL